MKEKRGFQLFTDIINFKDSSEPDYIVFSSSAPNFLTDPMWLVYKVADQSLTEITKDAIPNDHLMQMVKLTDQFLYNINEQRADEINKIEPEIFTKQGTQKLHSIYGEADAIHPTIMREYQKIIEASD